MIAGLTLSVVNVALLVLEYLHKSEDAVKTAGETRHILAELCGEARCARPHHIKNVSRLKGLLLTAVIIGLLTACGSEEDYVNTPRAETDIMGKNENSEEVHTNYLVVTSNDYNLLKPNFLYSTDNEAFWSIQANIAEDIHDIESLCVVRLDVPKENGVMPTSLDKTFSIEDTLQFEKFPGGIFVFNGEESTYNKVEEGVISFQSESTASGYVEGFFHVILTDYDSFEASVPQYRLTGTFGFQMGTFGSINVVPYDE